MKFFLKRVPTSEALGNFVFDSIGEKAPALHTAYILQKHQPSDQINLLQQRTKKATQRVAQIWFFTNSPVSNSK